MKMTELITLAENKLMALNRDMSNATQQGDAAEITRLDGAIQETQRTLDALRGIAG